MRTICPMLVFLLMLWGLNTVTATSFFICTSANGKEAATYVSYFETQIFKSLKKEFPCVEISSQSTIGAILEHERQRMLLGGEGRDLASIGGTMGTDYLVSLKVKVLQSTTLIEAFCANTRKNKVLSRVSVTAAVGDASLDAVEKASQQLLEGLKKHEICPFTGPINITVKTERTDKESDSYAVYCNGVDGMYVRKTSINSNSLSTWKLQKTRKYATAGSVTYSLFEEITTEEQNHCYQCPSGKKAARMLNEKIVKQTRITGLSNESISEGVQIQDARTEIIFMDNGTFTIKITAASKKNLLKKTTERTIEGPCENKQETKNETNQADVPLDETLGPFNGTSLDKVLTGTKTFDRVDPVTKEKTTITFDFKLTRD